MRCAPTMATAALLLMTAGCGAGLAAPPPPQQPSFAPTAAWPPMLIIDLVYPRDIPNDCKDDEYHQNPGGCLKCKTYEDNCNKTMECCGSKYLECRPYNTGSTVSKCVCGDWRMEWDEESQSCIMDNDNNAQFQFMTAAQVALGCALVIAVAALAALTCKMCAHRRRMEDVVRYHHRDSANTSLNSVQLFVLGRMRDRPPRYDDVPDKPPEYDGPQEEIAALPLPRIPVAASRMRLSHTRHQLPLALAQAAGASAAPPAYDEMETLPEVHDEQDAPTEPAVDANHLGQDNAAFVPDNANHM